MISWFSNAHIHKICENMGYPKCQKRNIKYYKCHFSNFQISKFLISKVSFLKFQFTNFKVSFLFNSNVSHLRIFKFRISQIPQCQRLGTQTFQQFQSFRFSDMKIRSFENAPIFSCIFWNILMINTGSEGPDLVDFWKFQKLCKKCCNMSGCQN